MFLQPSFERRTEMFSPHLLLLPLIKQKNERLQALQDERIDHFVYHEQMRYGDVENEEVSPSLAQLHVADDGQKTCVLC